MSRKHSKDQNHDWVFDTIRAFTAAHDLSACGDGVPDGCAWVNGGFHFFDVKNSYTAYGRKGLSPMQKDFADKDPRGGPVWLIHNIVEAEDFALGRWDKLRCYPPRRTSDPERIRAVDLRGSIK